MRSISLIAIVFLLVGCGDSIEWWQGVEADGRMYVLNQRSGELFTVEAGQVRPVERDAQNPWSPAVPQNTESVAQLHSVSDEQWLLEDVMHVAVETKYRRGRLSVRGTIEPPVAKLQQLPSTVITLAFQDVSSFRVASVDIRGEDLVRALGSDGKAAAMEFDTHADISPEAWSDARSIAITWTGRTSKAVKQWVKANPNDAQAMRDLAAAEEAAEQKRIEELLAKWRDPADDEKADVAAGPPDSAPAEGQGPVDEGD